jgi:uncharacterized protein YndB with AHSA1/START domain
MGLDVLMPDLLRAEAHEAAPAARRAGRLATVRVTSSIAASPARVFDAWLDPRIAGKWLFATATHPMSRVTIDARVRGRFRFADGNGGVEHTGIYVEIDRPRRLVFSLAATDALPVTRVIAEIAPRKAVTGVREAPGSRRTRVTATGITVRHGAVPAEHAARIEARWTGMLYGLGLMLNGT